MRFSRLFILGLLPALSLTALAQSPKMDLGKIVYPAWAKPTDDLLNAEKNDAALASLRKLPATYQNHYVFHVLAADIWDGKYQETSKRAEEIKYLKLELASLQKAKALAGKANARQVLPELDAEILAVTGALKKAAQAPSAGKK